VTPSGGTPRGVTSAGGEAASRLGTSLIEAGVPGPQDALSLVIEGFGDLARARQLLGNRSYLLGFSEGVSAGLLRAPWEWVYQHLMEKKIHRDIENIQELVGGVEGVKELANNHGVRDGYTFANKLTREARKDLQNQGITDAAKKGHEVRLDYRFDDAHLRDARGGVIDLALALQDRTILRMLEEAGKRAAQQQRALEDARYASYGTVSPQRFLELKSTIDEWTSPPELAHKLFDALLPPPESIREKEEKQKRLEQLNLPWH
jgi:hypothetical protein